MDLCAVDPDGARGGCRRTDDIDYEFDAGRPRGLREDGRHCEQSEHEVGFGRHAA
jgi:hypothetical protein